MSKFFGVPSIYGRWSHLCDTAIIFFGCKSITPGCLRPYPDMRDMYMSMLMGAWQSLVRNDREMVENEQELSENRTPGVRRGVSFLLWKVSVM
jgi:hypothetical protein